MVEDNIRISNLNKTLELGCSVLEEMNIPYILTGGTLLGIYRDKTLMAHDFDVDVDVLIEDVSSDFLDRFKKTVGLESSACDVTFNDNYYTARYVQEQEQIPFDVFLMFKMGNKRYRHFFEIPKDNPANERCLIWPERFYDKEKWTTIEYLGRKYPIPHDTEEYLEIFFGKDWKTPAKKWTWSACASNCHIFGDYKEWEK